ncbi:MULTISPECIES: hypothetical protein [unclassified Sinorhizobium]|uniref:hypothetical protein n=1 Tax=unclassified Sinorhizobium TaxID=2613772 RepID=UPI003523EB61
MNIRLYSLLIALIFPTFAHAAECPTEKTAKNGFILGNDAAVSEFRPARGSLVSITTTFGGSNKQIVYSFDGIFDLYRVDRQTRSGMHPLSDLSKIVLLKKGDHRVIDFVPFDPERSADQWALELTVMKRETMDLGQCKYDVLRVKQETKRNGATVGTLSFLYSPDLHATLAKIYDEGKSTEEVSGYDYIETLTQ